MSLSQRLSEYVAAAFTGVWIQSHEHPDALAEIGRLCRDRGWSLASWDVDRGLQSFGPVASQQAGVSAAGSADPVAAIRAVNALAAADGSALLVLPNFHRFLQSIEVVQALAHQIHQGKTNRTFVIVLSPLVQIPVELEKHFVVLHHDLPDRQQLEQIARGVATEDGELPAGEDLERLIDAASGLTRFEAEGAFALSLVRERRLTPRSVWELKEGMLKKSGLLQLHRGAERFADLGGLDALKSFCARSIQASGRKGSARARGVLLLGPPGVGKSALCKALGNETGRPTLLLDVGALLGSLVGQSEHNLQQALRIADAMSPAVLFCDEVEKALSGVASSGQTDSGVSARMFGALLTWLNDRTSDVYFVASCNDVSKLPPEFARAERVDGVFFLDLPGTADKDRIWPLYMRKYDLDEGQKLPEDRDWSGAEIASCCRLAALLDLPLKEAARNVVPVAVTAAESVERLRTWAAGRCLDASRPGVYTRGAAQPSPASSARRVSRPSSN